MATAVQQNIEIVSPVGTGASSKLYQQTKNPENKFNTDLHVSRYRDDKQVEDPSLDPDEFLRRQTEKVNTKREEFAKLYSEINWKQDHIHLFDDMDVSKFVIDAPIQRFMYQMQAILVDKPYNKFGKVAGSWDQYTLMFRNGFGAGRDERKPVTDQFQEFLEAVYSPLLWSFLFSVEGWAYLKRFYSQFKSCTIKVCEGTGFWGDNVFHMHIDGKIGLKQKNNQRQRRMNRLLWSIVKDAVSDEAISKELERQTGVSGVDFEDVDVKSSEAAARATVAATDADPYKYGTTCYPVWQPKKGFKNNHHFHKYMQKYYNEVGLLNSGLPRPHYEIPEDITYRAKSGEVLLHKSHGDDEGPQEIHSEPNPCPDRHLYVFDWTNVLHGVDENTKKQIPSEQVPCDRIIELMMPLSGKSSTDYTTRLRELRSIASGHIFDAAKSFTEGERIMADFLDLIDKELSRF